MTEKCEPKTAAKPTFDEINAKRFDDEAKLNQASLAFQFLTSEKAPEVRDTEANTDLTRDAVRVLRRYFAD